MSDLLIRKGKVWIEGGFQDKNILINDGKITGFSNWGSEKDSSNHIIDADGKMIFPGGVDIHAHVQDGAETFRHGTGSAVKGGVTTVLDMPPFQTVTSASQCESRVNLGKKESVSDFGLIGGIIIDHQDLHRLEEVIDCGVHLFKLFMLSKPPNALIWESVKFAARTGMRLVVHMEESSILSEVNWDNPLGFPSANPPAAENVAVAQLLEMARAAGAPIHVCHVSSGRTVELINTYKEWGTDVTAETTPHYLLLNETEFLKQPERVIATPALRKQEDNKILWQALEDGVIDAIVSDHFLGALPDQSRARPHPKDAEPGIAGLEVTFPLLYDRGFNENNISLVRLIETFSASPAKLGGIHHRKGKLEIGMDADLVILDPNKKWQVCDVGLNSRVSTLPYEGWELKGKLDQTLVRGEVVWDGSNIAVDPGYGDFIGAKIYQ